jgi:alpha-L-fucosidase
MKKSTINDFIRKSMKKGITLLLALLAFTTLSAQYQPDWNSLDKREIPQWWKDAKFGIFIHWGVYSVPAYAPVNEVDGVYEKYAEHYYNRLLSGNKFFKDFHTKHYGEEFSYADFAPMFKAEYFNPDEWAELFREAGAKYVVLTSKHHDGFCLWPSTHSPRWNSMVTGPHSDLIGELSTSVRNSGLRFGLYYSLLEWAHPLYSKSTIEEWVDTHMIPQMKELVNNYQPEIIFSDGEWDYDSKTLKSEEFLAWLYNESPVKNSVVVNDRWGKETRSRHGGYYTTEYDLVHSQKGIGDKADHPWEESRGIGTSYGYNRFETTKHYLSSKRLIDILIDKVTNGGNFLLNIGPDATGMIPVVMQERLLDIGKWLKVNGDAIYSSQPWRSPNKPKEGNLHFTRKDGNLYIILKKWQKDPIILTGLKSAGKAELLGYKGDLKSTLQQGKLTITLPQLTVDELPCEHAWVIKVTNFAE